MRAADLALILPEILIAVGAVTLMMSIAFYRNYTLSFGITLAALVAAFAAIVSRPGPAATVTPLFIVDSYSLFYSLLLVAATLAVVLMSYRYLKDRPGIKEEYYLLVLLSCLGALVLVSSNHLASFFLGLELLGVSLYALISYHRTSDRGLEAGIKYLVLAGASSAFLLFGMAIAYYEVGSMRFADLAGAMSEPGGFTLAGFAGTALILVGVGFKLGVVPFHMWTPDVYEGSPAPIAAFIATVSKGSIFALLVRYFATADMAGRLLTVFTLIAVASMLAGNLLALFQENVKRILAYSSIAHMGYALVAFLSAGSLRVTAVTFYLLSYFISALGAFGVVIALSGPEREADRLEDYRGLFTKSPWLTFLFSLFLISLAGLPLTAGFIGKFYVMRAGVGSDRWLLVISLIGGSAIGLFYYLRVLAVMFVSGGSRSRPGPLRFGLWQNATLAILAGCLLWLGLSPGNLLRIIGSLGMG